jgi:sporulation protein YabP
MEEKQVAGQHRLTIDNRKSGTFTGVTDIVSFDPNEILLQTELGMLHVKGRGLHVSRLDLAKKEVEMQGEVEAFHYTGSPQKKAPGGILTRVFGS